MARVAWKPNPGPQTAFLACPVREVLYGGSLGGGKTDALVMDALDHIVRYGRHAKALILRENFPQLSEIIERAEILYPLQGGKYNKVSKTWRFPNGGRIIFGHLEKGYTPYWGKEYTWMGIDELTRSGLSQSDYLKLLSRLRSSKGVPCFVRATTNPGGAGHAWVKQRFYEAAKPMTVVRDEKGLERVFIPAKLTDNPHLLKDPSYLASLEGLPDKERRAFLHGDWDAFEGTVFNLEKGIHIWTWAQFKERTGFDKPPQEWTRFRSMDWGYAKPFAVYWYAVDYEGRAYVYREYYGVAKDGKGQAIPNEGARLEPEKVAEKVATIEKEAHERIASGWSGPDIGQNVRADHGGGKKIEDHFRAHGVHWQYWKASPGSRLAGKMALHQRLAYERDPQTNEIREWPGLIFIEEACPHAIRTIPALEYDEHQPEQVDTDGEDHAYDSISGFCKMKPWKPVKKTEQRDGWRERKLPSGSSWVAG